MKKKILTIIITAIILALSVLISYFLGHNQGYKLGAAVTPQQKIDQLSEYQKGVTNEKLVNGYYQLYTLCEQKYQHGLKGDINQAQYIKGQMTQIENQVSQLEGEL